MGKSREAVSSPRRRHIPRPEETLLLNLQNYAEAMSIAKISEHERAALLYRSLANPRPQRPKMALLDAIRARNNGISTENGLFRETMAHYALEQFSLCAERLQQALALNPGNKDTEKELERTTRKYMQGKLLYDQQQQEETSHTTCGIWSQRFSSIVPVSETVTALVLATC